MESQEARDSQPDEETNMKDLTMIISACAASLSVKDPFLCNEEGFSLYDSMSALVIMDPKMDCCEIPLSVLPIATGDSVADDPTILVPPRPLPKGIDDDVQALPWDELTLRNTASISIESLTRLKSLLCGASVAESTFTCLYAHKPVLSDMKTRVERATDASLAAKLSSLMKDQSITASRTTSNTFVAQHALYATTLANVELSDLVRSIVLHADIYEEEDFNTSTCGLDFSSKENTNQSTRVIPLAIDVLDQVDEADESDAQIVRLVLQFQLELLNSCASMGMLTPENARSTAESTKRAVASGLNHLKELRTIFETGSAACSLSDPILKRVFDPFLYRPLVGNTPIRRVSFCTPIESIVKLEAIFGEIDWTVCDLLLHGKSLGRLRRMMERFSSSSVNILSRSLMVLNLYFGDRLLGQYIMTDLIIKHIQQISGMPDSWIDIQHVHSFVERLVKPVYDTLKMLLLNRNRHGAFMENVVFQGWTALQADGLSVDAAIMNAAMNDEDLSGPPCPLFSTYIRAELTRLMDHHVALSVELTLVRGHHDLAVSYWYRDYLLSSLLMMLAALKQAKHSFKLQPQHEASAAKSRGKKKAGKRAGKKKVPIRSALLTEDSLDDFEYATSVLKRDLCKGIAKFFAALNQANLVRLPCYRFTSHEIRFQQRFDPFALVSAPPLLTYEDFLKGSDFSSVSQSELLAATDDCFTMSKKVVDELLSQLPNLNPMFLLISEDELRSAAKVCVGNSVFVMKLSQLAKSGHVPANQSVLIDLDTNRKFCMIKIT